MSNQGPSIQDPHCTQALCLACINAYKVTWEHKISMFPWVSRAFPPCLPIIPRLEAKSIHMHLFPPTPSEPSILQRAIVLCSLAKTQLSKAGAGREISGFLKWGKREFWMRHILTPHALRSGPFFTCFSLMLDKCQKWCLHGVLLNHNVPV